MYQLYGQLELFLLVFIRNFGSEGRKMLQKQLNFSRETLRRKCLKNILNTFWKLQKCFCLAENTEKRFKYHPKVEKYDIKEKITVKMKWESLRPDPALNQRQNGNKINTAHAFFDFRPTTMNWILCQRCQSWRLKTRTVKKFTPF